MNRETAIERRVLASLAGRDMDLETIADRLARPFGRYPGIGDSACARSVARLAEDDLVTVAPEYDRPFEAASTTAERTRETYAITDAGRERLRSLAREPLRPARGLR